ncbi:MAG: hypothetical protein AAGE79_14900 [Acinetobacter pittii]
MTVSEQIRDNLSKLLKEIFDIINETKVLRGEKTLKMKNFSTPSELKKAVEELLDEYLYTLNQLSEYIDSDEIDFIKDRVSKQFSKVTIVISSEPKASNWSNSEFVNYNKFRTVQLELKTKIIKSLKKESNKAHRGKKFIWIGSQKNLVELFDELYKKGWIKEEPISQELLCLPIIESFNILKSGNVEPINEDSFNKAWKKDSPSDTRNGDNYEPVFNNIPKNARSSKI